MKSLVPQLDGMPLPLRCLSAYTALCAAALAILGIAEFVHDPSAWSATRSSWAMPLEAIALYGVAQLLTVAERWAWTTLVSVMTLGVAVAVVFQTTGIVLGVCALVVLSLPSSRAFAQVTPPAATHP